MPAGPPQRRNLDQLCCAGPAQTQMRGPYWTPIGGPYPTPIDNFDIYLNDFSSYGDPAIGVARAFVTDAIGRVSGNAPGYSNPEVDQLFTDGAKATSEEERARIYQSITPILVRDLPLVMLHELSGFDGASQKLHGLWGWMGNGRWGNASLDE